MIIVRLTNASHYARLWAAEEVLKRNCDDYRLVQVVHSPDDKQTLIIINDAQNKNNLPYLDVMPVGYSQQLSQKEFDVLAKSADTAALDIKSARQQLALAQRAKQDLAVVISLDKLQESLSNQYANALKKIVNDPKSKESLQNPEYVSGVLVFCISDLAYKQLLPSMVAVRKMERSNVYSLSMVDLNKTAKVGLWLTKHGIINKMQPDSSYSGSIIFQEDKGSANPGFIIFDSTAGRENQGTTLIVREGMLDLATALLPGYDLLLKSPATRNTNERKRVLGIENETKIVAPKKRLSARVNAE